MTMTEVLQALNLVNILNTFLPPGSGELIVLGICSLGLAALVLLIMLLATTGNLVKLTFQAKFKKGIIGFVPLPTGITKLVLINQNSKEYHDDDMKDQWVLSEKTNGLLDNGVRYTILSPRIGTTINIEQLANAIVGGANVTKESLMGELNKMPDMTSLNLDMITKMAINSGNLGDMPTAGEVRSKTFDLADMLLAKKGEDLNKKLFYLGGIIILVVLAIGGMYALISILGQSGSKIVCDCGNAAYGIAKNATSLIGG